MSEYLRWLDAARRDPRDPEARRNLLKVAVRVGKAEEALAVLAPPPEDPGVQPRRDQGLVDLVGQLGLGFGDPRPYPHDRPRVAAVARRGRRLVSLDTAGKLREAWGPDWEEGPAWRCPVDAPFFSTQQVSVPLFQLTRSGRLLIAVETVDSPMLDPREDLAAAVIDLESRAVLLDVPAIEDQVFLAADAAGTLLLLGGAPGLRVFEVGPDAPPPYRPPLEPGTWIADAKPGPRAGTLGFKIAGGAAPGWALFDAASRSLTPWKGRRAVTSTRVRCHGPFPQWTDREQRLVVRPETPREPVVALGVGPGGRTLRSLGPRGELRVHDLSGGRRLQARWVSGRWHRLDRHQVVLPAPRARRGQGPTPVRLVDPETWTVEATVEVPAPRGYLPSGGDVDPGAGLLVLGYPDGEVMAFDLTSGDLRWSHPKDRGLFYARAEFVHGGRRLVVSHRQVGQGTRVRLVVPGTGRRLWTAELPRTEVGFEAARGGPGEHLLLQTSDFVQLRTRRGHLVPLVGGGDHLPVLADFLPEQEALVTLTAGGMLQRRDLAGRVEAEVRTGSARALCVLPGGAEVVLAQPHFLRRWPVPR